MRPGDRRPEQGGGGVPDGLLIALLGFLVGLTLLVWSATGLAGLFAHGAWPDAITFTRTPLAVRSLASNPQDLAAAWPDTPAAQLSGYGLFWGLFIGQLMILLVLTVFVMGTLARWRSVRAREKAARAQGKSSAAPTTAPTEAQGHTTPHTTPYATPHATGYAHSPDSRAGAPGGPATPPVPPHTGSHTGGLAPPAGFPAAPSTPSTPVPEPRHGAPSAPLVPATEAPRAAPPGPHPTTPLTLATGTEPAAPPAHPRPGGTEAPAALHTGGWASAPPRSFSAPPNPVAPPPPRPYGTPRAPPWWSRPTPPSGRTRRTPARSWARSSSTTPHTAATPRPASTGPPSCGCEDKPTALARAIALLAPIRPTARLDQAMADTAETLLRSYLHAAAIDTRTIRHLHRWAQGSNVQEAVRTLRTNPKAAPGAAGELESALTSHPERRDIAQQLTARALSALSTVNVRESCTPNRADSLVLDSFVHEGERSMWSATPSRTPRRTLPRCRF